MSRWKWQDRVAGSPPPAKVKRPLTPVSTRIRLANGKMVDTGELVKDLERLDLPAIGHSINLCYGDGYYVKSLEQKYGKSIGELRQALA
jgi:hypothetical protein